MEFSQEQKLYAQVVQKAWDDANFKSELVANPTEAIEKLTGKKPNLPEGKTLVVRDLMNDSSVYIDIPPKPNFDELQLSDEQLEMIAGGEIAASAGLALACIALFGAGVSIGLAIK